MCFVKYLGRLPENARAFHLSIAYGLHGLTFAEGVCRTTAKAENRAHQLDWQIGVINREAPRTVDRLQDMAKSGQRGTKRSRMTYDHSLL